MDFKRTLIMTYLLNIDTIPRTLLAAFILFFLFYAPWAYCVFNTPESNKEEPLSPPPKPICYD